MRGAFTGADRARAGQPLGQLVGDLFLDEIGEMSLTAQVSLLRVLQDGEFTRVGGNEVIKTDVRVIAASNRDPEDAIADGKLRLDLYHRLNVFPLLMPPLRERGDDVELLAQHFLDELNVEHGAGKILMPDGLVRLKGYHWPGNVRELRNYMQRAFILSDGEIDAEVLTPAVSPQASVGHTLAIPVGTSLAEVDRKLIFATLELCGGVKKRAADILGISLKTLYNRLEEYGPYESDEDKGSPMPVTNTHRTDNNYGAGSI